MSFPAHFTRSSVTQAGLVHYLKQEIDALRASCQLNSDIESHLEADVEALLASTLSFGADNAGIAFAHTTTHQLTATVKTSAGTDITSHTTVEYASSNTGVATVNSSGLVTGVAAGTCNITATCEGVTTVVAATLS